MSENPTKIRCAVNCSAMSRLPEFSCGNCERDTRMWSHLNVEIHEGISENRTETAHRDRCRGSCSHRMLQPVTPLADKLGKTGNTSYAKGDAAGVAAAVAKLSGTTLVSWEHSEIPDIAAHLGAVSPAPPSSWPDERFDMVWVFT